MLARAGDPERARAMKAYMRGQFDYFGVPTPERRRLARPILKADLTPALERFWEEPEREFAYCALDCLDLHKLVLPLATLRHLLTTKSWWDTVDALAATGVGRTLQAHPELASRMDEWNQDENLWLRRTSLIYQLSYKARTDAPRLFRYVDALAHEKEFFIRKAIGWALRQYARTAPDEVRAFLSSRKERLSGLSWREATKHLTV